MDVLAANLLPWLNAAQSRLRESAAAQRLPHSLLLLSTPGLGAESLAHWASGFALCEASEKPCGKCSSCILLRADSHPDFHVVRIEEDAQQIKIDQVRDLIEALALKSYRGGYRVGLIEEAETLNTHSANAFLKTLEEPPQSTLLIMIARPNHRLPATIASRCLKIKLRIPSLDLAGNWLAEKTGQKRDWLSALALTGGAPLLALELDIKDIAVLETDMRECVTQLTLDAVDITLLAERWLKSHVGLRIAWLENWITGQIRSNVEPVGLPPALLKAKIRSLFELQDAIHEFRRFASTGMNQQLALETLLLGGRAAFAG